MDELELFIVHKEADVDHSEAQFGTIERCFDKYAVDDIKRMLNRTFMTSKGYDTQKLVLGRDGLRAERTAPVGPVGLVRCRWTFPEAKPQTRSLTTNS